MAAEQIEPAVRLGEWFVVIATILGPVLAVQAQKWVERGHAKQAMKDGIFRTLMATRAARLSPEHVQALNMIDIAFYGSRTFGQRSQTKAEKTVTLAWGDYFDSLGLGNDGYTEDQADRLMESRFEKFIVLLSAIASAQNYEFDPLALKRKMYSPVHQARVEDDQTAIRVGLAKILRGDAAFPMNVTNLPDRQDR